MATRRVTGRSDEVRALRISGRSSSTETLAWLLMTENQRCRTGTLRRGRAVRDQKESGLMEGVLESRRAKATLTDSGKKSGRSIRLAMKTAFKIPGMGSLRRRLLRNEARMKGSQTRNPPHQPQRNRELRKERKGSFRKMSQAVERGRGMPTTKLPARLPKSLAT